MENETVINIDENTVDSNSIGKRNKRRNVSKDNFQINKDLNLSPRETQSLKDFVEEKQPKSNIEFNVVAIYYLERILKRQILVLMIFILAIKMSIKRFLLH